MTLEKDHAMTTWQLCRWHGPPATLAAALREFGWHGPGEPPAAGPDPRIGGFLPPPGQAPHKADGLAYGALAAREALPLPAGLSDTEAELSASLIGSF